MRYPAHEEQMRWHSDSPTSGPTHHWSNAVVVVVVVVVVLVMSVNVVVCVHGVKVPVREGSKSEGVLW